MTKTETMSTDRVDQPNPWVVEPNRNNSKPFPIPRGSFTTAKGSVYEYDELGHVKRIKSNPDGEQHGLVDNHDLTVFIDQRNIEGAPLDIISARHPDKTKQAKFYIQEITPYGVVTRWNIQDVIDPNKLLFVVRRGSDTGPAISRAKASIYPDVGAQVMQVSEDTDQHTHSRHPGHNVNNIDNIRI